MIGIKVKLTIGRVTFFSTFATVRAVSSVGSEHRLDRAGVGGSSPLQLTIKGSQWLPFIFLNAAG